MKNELIEQLIILNQNVHNLSETISHKSFWDSQLFAAILGSSSAVIVLLVQSFLKWRVKRNQRLDEIYNSMAEQLGFYSPEVLYRKAANTIYQSTTKDKNGNIIREIPEKPLGEKMVIELRSNIKYWRFPNSKIRRLFGQYEKSLRAINHINNDDQEQLSQANKFFEKLQQLSFQKTGENEWTC